MVDTPGYIMPMMEEIAVQYLPVDFNSTSQKLSRALDSIGINKEGVLRQRIARLQSDTVSLISFPLFHKINVSISTAGSQCEISTTRALNSDMDTVMVCHDFNVTENPNDKSGSVNLFMHTSSSIPGYCKLRLIADDVILAAQLPYFLSVNGFAFLRNTSLYSTDMWNRAFIHGPALHFPQQLGVTEIDRVAALNCKTWPKTFRHWSSDNMNGHWPTAEMIDSINKSGCFVVPTAHCLSENQELEWRISTSAAERCLMFNLNITQLRCYILLKMILKTFIKSQFPKDTITSYHCKTVLFHCIENSSPKLWIERKLLKCVTVCLCFLLDCLKDINLPNYFNDRADLFLGKFDYQIQDTLVCIVGGLLNSKGEYLKKIDCDGLNMILLRGDVSRDTISRQRRMNVLYGNSLVGYCISVVSQVRLCILLLKDDIKIADVYARVHTATSVYSKLGVMEYISACAFLSNICSHLACISASRRLERDEKVCTSTECLFRQSMKSDVVSSRLKYASFLLCTGHQEQSDSILQQVEKILYRSNTNYCYVCCCYSDMTFGLSEIETLVPETVIEKEKKKSYLTTDNAAFCVMFTNAEKLCFPKEMQYELFRTITLKDRLSIDEDYHVWMDSGVVDPLPFLFFLKYKVSQHLGNKREKANSLRKLCACINDRQRLPHRATAYNLLGQCWELEHESEKAFCCYYMSLRDSQTNNSARWHIAVLAFSIWRSRRLERDNTVDVLNSQQDGQTIKSQVESTDKQNLTLIYQRKPTTISNELLDV